MAKVPLRNYNREIETMIDRGQLDEAIAHSQHILKTFPKHLETYRLLGKAYLEYKRRNEAADIFLRVLAAEPNDFVANVGMSILRDEENKLDDAIWHMERAFEVQPSNPAIQAELQRLYGRRDGVTPPRIRMTRGALAHMYVQGELYPQAISEIKSVLKEDHGRSDMQALLARAYFKSGQKNDAAEAANSVLRRYPYCLDANRVLAEIFGADRPENAQVYRQRVVELDPYAAQVTGTIFQANEVSDNAVSLEALDWNAQPAHAQAGWDEKPSFAADDGGEPDWLRSGFAESTPPPPAKPTVVPPVQASPASFELSAPSEPAAVPTPAEEIPEFLRAAGWGKSTGAFDESKSSFADELEASASAASNEPIEQADLPDWVKEMMPQNASPSPVETAQPAAEEELPDWIKNIGPGAVAGAAAAGDSAADVDWLQDTEESASSLPGSDATLNWMKGLDQPAESASPASIDDSLDWLKGLDQPGGEETPAAPEATENWMPPASTGDDSLDWLKNLDQPAAESATPAESSQPEWMNNFEQPAATPSESADDSLDWLKGLDQPAAEAPLASASQSDWLDSAESSAPLQAAPDEQPDWLKGTEQPIADSSASADDSLDWLKGFDQPAAEESAAPQPESKNEFDWLDGVGEEPQPSAPVSEPTLATNDFDFFEEEPTEKPTEPRVAPVPPIPPLDSGSLGTSQKEIDDSLAWLENLAAKQGATEGLLTKPEERLQDEPDWVKKIKGSTPKPAIPEPLAAEPMPAPQEPVESTPAAKMDDLGKSQQEIDDSLAWLENLAAKQGATEGLLTKPEERKQEEPEWVKKIKGSTPRPAAPEPVAAEPTPVSQEPVAQAPVESVPAAQVEDLGKSQQEIDDSLAWLENLAAKQGATEGLLTKPEERLQEEPEWVKQAKSTPVPQEPVAQTPPEVSQPEPVGKVEDLGKSQQEIDDSLAWLENLAAKQGATEGLLTKPEERLQDEPEWVKQAKSAPVPQEPVMADQPPIEDEAIEEPRFDFESQLPEAVEPEPVKDESDTGTWFDRLEDETAEPAVSEALPSDEMPEWLRNLEVEDTQPTPAQTSADMTAMWFKDLAEPEQSTSEAEPAPVAESGVPAEVPGGDFAWLDEVESGESGSPVTQADDNLPSWLRGVDDETRLPQTDSLRGLPGWMQDETGEVLAEPTRIEPTRPDDWQPKEAPHRETPSVAQPVEPEPVAQKPVEEPKPKPVRKPKPAEPKREPYREPVTLRGTGMLTMPVDPILGSARNELSRSNIPGALESYGKLIKKGRYLDEVIFDLREALDRFPVEVSILQTLGDAYMRANRLQDALDAYTKAEELLR